MGLRTDGDIAAARLGADGRPVSWFSSGGEILEFLTDAGAVELE
jgi:hypothetical protein